MILPHITWIRSTFRDEDVAGSNVPKSKSQRSKNTSPAGEGGDGDGGAGDVENF